MIRLTRSQVQPIGVDIGADSVRMLQLETSSPRALAVRAAARREVPEEARRDPALRLPAAAELIRQMLRTHGFVGRSVVVAMPREIVHVKNLRLPKIPPAELDAAVQFEARNIFPFDTDLAHVRQLYAGEVRQGNDVKQEVIVLAARQEETNAFVELLHRAGCAIESLDFEPSSIYRSVERFIRRREDEQEVFVLVDVGMRCAQVIIGRGREMTFFKTIDAGGRHFNEAVSRKLEITVAEARELRRRMIGEPAPTGATGQRTAAHVANDPVRQAVFDATRGLMDELAREVALCLRYHSVTFRGHRPAKLRLTGGEACDPQLQSILSGALPIPVEAARPLHSVDTTRMQPGDRRAGMSEWTVAFGLGLKLTTDYFGARDGKQRTGPAPAALTAGGAEVIDVNRAVSGEPAASPTSSPSALTTSAIAAASRPPAEVAHA